MPGFPVLPYLLEFAQTHVHGVDYAIQPSIFSILSIDPFIQPSIHPFSLATHLSIYLSISVSIHSSIHPFSLSIYLVSWPFCLTQNHTALKLQSQIQKMAAVWTLALASHRF